MLFPRETPDVIDVDASKTAAAQLQGSKRGRPWHEIHQIGSPWPCQSGREFESEASVPGGCSKCVNIGYLLSSGFDTPAA